MRAIFDVNVLIALLDMDHVGHNSATTWHSKHLKEGWASCPLTENGAARVMSSPGYPHALPVAEVVQRIAQSVKRGNHRFWPDDVSLTDTAVFKHAELLGPKQITDRYLLALAVKNKGRLVTFDQGIRTTGVVGAAAKHLVQIS